MLTDTDPQAAELQWEILRRMTRSQRSSLLGALTTAAFTHAYRAIMRAHPRATLTEITRLAIGAHYGERLANAVVFNPTEPCRRGCASMSQSLLIAALRPVTQLLDQLAVHWYVVGSVASSMHGVPRTTLDADIVTELERQHVKPFVAALKSDYYVSESMILNAVERQRSFKLIHYATSFKIDLFVNKQRPFDQSVKGRIQRDSFTEQGEELPLMVASAEDVILSKLAWYRQGNEISDHQWLDILGIFRVQQSNLDSEYLLKWAFELNITDLLERAWSELAPPPDVPF